MRSQSGLGSNTSQQQQLQQLQQSMLQQNVPVTGGPSPFDVAIPPGGYQVGMPMTNLLTPSTLSHPVKQPTLQLHFPTAPFSTPPSDTRTQTGNGGGQSTIPGASTGSVGQANTGSTPIPGPGNPPVNSATPTPTVYHDTRTPGNTGSIALTPRPQGVGSPPTNLPGTSGSEGGNPVQTPPYTDPQGQTMRTGQYADASSYAQGFANPAVLAWRNAMSNAFQPGVNGPQGDPNWYTNQLPQIPAGTPGNATLASLGYQGGGYLSNLNPNMTVDQLQKRAWFNLPHMSAMMPMTSTQTSVPVPQTAQATQVAAQPSMSTVTPAPVNPPTVTGGTTTTRPTNAASITPTVNTANMRRSTY